MGRRESGALIEGCCMRRKALIVLDNDDNQHLAPLLEHAGFEVVAASSGRIRIESACAAVADIILLDIQMRLAPG
jgi:CheY-like chemotaxis protein